MCAMKVGVSPCWKSARSHSASLWPLEGPPSQMPWQQTMMSLVGRDIAV